MEKTIKEVPMTRLQGIKNFIYTGVISGELDTEMTLAQLLPLLDDLMEQKMESYNAKLREIKSCGNEDDIFS